MSQTAPLSTLVAPVLKEETRDRSKPSKEGLIIGITCGVLGLVAIIIIILVIGLKFKRKKKTREEAEFDRDASTNSNAQLLSDDSSEPNKSNNILEKYGILTPLDAKKSTSCPDIYSVNKSIALQIGSAKIAYEQLEKSSMDDGAKYKSDERLGAPNQLTGLSKSMKDLKTTDEVDGPNFFQNDNHIYHLPSIDNDTYNRKSMGDAGKHDSGIYLVSHGSKIPLFIEPSEKSHENIEQYVSGYQSPTSQINSELSLPTQHPYVNVDIPGYKTPTSGSPRVMPKNRNSGVAMYSSGYRTPTSNSPKLFPKTGLDKKITPNQIRMEMENDDDNIYDVPKFDDNSIYTNIPNDVRASIISQGSSAGDRKVSHDDHYQAPPPPVPQHTQRSFSIGSSKERQQRPPENQIYEIPPNHFSNSQPSLLKTKSSEVRPVDRPERPAHHSMIYDVPSRSHTLDQSTISRNNIKNEKPPPPRRNTDGVKHKKDLDAERRRSSDINANKNKYIEPPVAVGDFDDTIYDVPSHTLDRTKYHNVDSSTIDKIPVYNHIVDNSRTTTCVENEREHYIDLDKLHRESNSHYKVRHDEENREMTYDIPKFVDRSSSLEDGTNISPYYNIAAASSTLEKKKSDGLMKKMGYDVPNINAPVFDPSQPSLLKLASQNLYKNPASVGHQQHHQSKFPPVNRPTTHEKPVASDIPEYDPATAYTTRPLNKNFNSPKHGNRSMHYAGDSSSIYDVPANHKRATGSHDSSDGHDTDSIYQNVYQLEDGQNGLRSFNPNGQVC